MSWLAYTLVVAVLVAAGAAAVERALRLAGRPARHVWAVSSLLTVGLPGAALLGWTGVIVRRPPPVSVLTVAEVSSSGLRVGPALFACWATLSVVALLLIGIRTHRVRRLARAWPTGSIGGIRVLISPATGPATIGVLRPEIVVPRWLFDMGTRFRRLAVLHEQEHRRVGDVALLNGMAVLVALVPWHPVLWWQAARLHRAIELDCDERVVRRVGDRPGYGRMLIEAATRRTAAVPLAAGLGLHRPLLEHRIRTLVASRRRRASPAIIALATALLAIACALPTPFEPAPGSGPERGRATYRLTEIPRDSLPAFTGGPARAQFRDSIAEPVKAIGEMRTGGVLRRADPDDPRLPERPRH